MHSRRFGPIVKASSGRFADDGRNNRFLPYAFVQKNKIDALRNKFQIQPEEKQNTEENIGERQGTITVKGKSLAEFLK